MRTGSKQPVLTAYFPVLAYGILGKRKIALPELTGSSTQAQTCGTDLQLIGNSVADYQALTRPDVL